MVRAQTRAVTNDHCFDSLSGGLQPIVHATPTFVAKMGIGVQKVDNLPYRILRYPRDAGRTRMRSRIWPLPSPRAKRRFYRMKVLGRLSLAVLASAAFLSPPSSHAAVVSISQEKANECGRGFVFCNGRQAYSLSEIESGAIQIPVFPILPSEVVIVNDTGHTVNTLQFSFTTIQLFSFDVQCLIQPSLKSDLKTCNVTKTSSGLSRNLFSTVSADFTFEAGNKKGIEDGEYFDITTIGFLPGGYLCGGSGDGGSGGGGGGGTGGGGTGGGGTGGGGTGNPGPPQQ
jgi:uncharacterized membrane protein YgcG